MYTYIHYTCIHNIYTCRMHKYMYMYIHINCTCTCTCLHVPVYTVYGHIHVLDIHMYMYIQHVPMYMYMYQLHVHWYMYNPVMETRQMQAMTPEDNSFFQRKRKAASGGTRTCDVLLSRQTAVLAEPRQLSWAGRIFKVCTRQMASLP